MSSAIGANKDIAPNLEKASDDLSPLRALQLLRAIPDEDAELLWCNPT
jgi:hypothetical protein